MNARTIAESGSVRSGRVRGDARARKLLIALCLLGVAGCAGSDEGPNLSKVSGSVSHKGQPAAGAVVAFYPQTPGDGALQIPQATVADDGTFELITRAGAGAPPGEYKVTVVWYEPAPPGVNSETYSPRDRLRSRYADPQKSGLVATITDEPTMLPPFELD